MEPIVDPEHQELEERLLRAGKDVQMSPALRAKTLAAIAAGTVGVTTATTAKAGTLGWLTSKGGTLWGATSLLGGAGVVGAAIVATTTLSSPTPTPEQPPESVAVAQEAAPAAATVEAPEEEAMPAVELDLSDLGEEPAEEEPSPGVKKKQDRAKVERKSVSDSSTLGAELAHIARVESALRAGRPAGALSLLKEYRGRFPRPQLGLEAEVLTIQALHESGSVLAAQKRAAAFVSRYPRSPLGVRAKQYLK